MKLFKLLLLSLLFGVMNASVAVAATPSGVGLALFVDGLASPVAMVNAPNTFFYVAELGGKIRVLNSNGSLRPQPAINVADPQFSCRWLGQMQTMPMDRLYEGGLLNIALDPNFDTNLTLYFYYTTANALVLARMKFEPINQEALVPSSCEVVLQLPHASTAHLGGSLGFGRDGLLYLGIGNNHRFCEQYLARSQTNDCIAPASINNVQFNPNSGLFYGKILRLNILNPSAVGHTLCGVPSNSAALYSVPLENTFGPSDKCPEIFAYGLRNPWRFSVDKVAGDLLIGDVGEGRTEELSVLKNAITTIPSGANLGWPCFEGFYPYSTTSSLCSALPFAATHAPIMTFDFVDRFRTIIGGYRYRGALSPFNGFYLGADAADAKVVIAPPKTVAAIGQPQIPWDYVARKSAQMFNTTTTLGYPVSLAQDNAGNLYLLDLYGAIYRFTFNADVEFQSRFE